jgi:hypothetical protein
MVAGTVFEEWLNQNRNRRYPFFDGATLKDTTNTLTLPNELITDLVFPVHAMDYDPAKFYLKEVTVFSGGVVLSLGYEGEADAIATRSITEAGHTENKAYYIEGAGDFSDSVGRINIGRFDAIKDFGGTYTFSAAASRIMPTALRPSLKGVTGLRIVNADNELSALLQGDIELVQGDNILLELLPVGVGDPKRLRISAVNNPAYDAGCSCPDEASGTCIQRINGVAPDPSGDFTLQDDGCLDIDETAVANGLLLSDTCAEPCCGCEELETLRTELARLGSQIATQRSFAQRAFSNVEQLRNVILSSKFGSVIPC